MKRIKYLACALALAATACGSNDTLTTPTTNNNVTIDFTDSVNGPLTKNGSQTFSFATLATGTISAQLVSMNPDGLSGQPVGMAVGVLDTSGACQRVVWNDHLLVSTSVIATATAISSFCVSLYDSTGTLPQPQTFDIQVSHP